MENREIIDKTYYLLEESMTKDRTPGFFYCTIMADKSHMYGDIEQFNEFALYLMSEFSKDRLVEYAFSAKEETADKHFVHGKMLAAKHTWEYETGWIFKRKETFTNIHTICKGDEFLKYKNKLYEDIAFSILVYPYKELNFECNNPQLVMEYVVSEDYIISVLPEIVNPQCWFEVNTKYMSKEEFISQLTILTEKTGRKLEVEI